MLPKCSEVRLAAVRANANHAEAYNSYLYNSKKLERGNDVINK
jgi:hypothetical protein